MMRPYTKVILKNWGSFLQANRVESYKLAMFYWLHMDTITGHGSVRVVDPRKKERKGEPGTQIRYGEEP